MDQEDIIEDELVTDLYIDLTERISYLNYWQMLQISSFMEGMGWK